MVLLTLNVHDKYILRYSHNNQPPCTYKLPDLLNTLHYSTHIEQKGSAEKILDNHNKTAFCHIQNM